jgi:molybdopterin-guanine dinucleotide biosynthesis protein A
MEFTSLSGVVLAGGKSERMGHQDKGLLLFQNEPMALQVSQAFKSVTDYVFINANRNIEQYSALGFDVLSDVDGYSEKGPLSGLFASLNYVSSSHLVVSPCDTPCISGAAFLELQMMSKEFPDKIHYLKSASGSHPLHAILPVASSLLALKVFLDQIGRNSVMAFYEAFGCQEVLWSKDSELLNVNTPNYLK